MNFYTSPKSWTPMKSSKYKFHTTNRTGNRVHLPVKNQNEAKNWYVGPI